MGFVNPPIACRAGPGTLAQGDKSKSARALYACESGATKHAVFHEKVALAGVKGDGTLSQLSEHFDVPPAASGHDASRKMKEMAEGITFQSRTNVSLAIIAMVNSLGTTLNTKFTDINSSLK